jgi:hypothetical protein
MKRGYGKKLPAIAIGVILATFIFTSQAFAWGSATHAYIDDRLGKQGPLRNLNEIYGGMAPDVFNYFFGNPDWLEYLYTQTHYDNYLALWKEAHTILEKAVVFGFVSHNGMSGADLTAHGSYDYKLETKPTGWVIANAVEMSKIQAVKDSLIKLGLVQDDLVLVAGYELCHTFVESAVDLLLARHDRSLGGKISAAALTRAREFPDLLVKSYARGFAKEFGLNHATAVRTIRSAENEFRRNMVSYGLALAQEPDVAKELIVEQLVDLAPAFLASYGVSLPNGTELDDLKPVADALIEIAITLCEDGDYLRAVERTIPFVSKNLAKMGISY